MRYTRSEYEEASKNVDKRLRKSNAFRRRVVAFIIFNLAAWVIYNNGSGLTFGWDTPWPLLMGLLWANGLIASGVETVFGMDSRPQTFHKRLVKRLEKKYGKDWQYHATEQDIKAARQRIRMHNNVYVGLIRRVLSFPPLAVFFWLVWESGLTFGLDFPWPVIIYFIWAISLVLNTLGVFLVPGASRIQTALDKEEKQQRAKRKPDLDDDTEDDEYDWVEDDEEQLYQT